MSGTLTIQVFVKSFMGNGVVWRGESLDGCDTKCLLGHSRGRVGSGGRERASSWICDGLRLVDWRFDGYSAQKYSTPEGFARFPRLA